MDHFQYRKGSGNSSDIFCVDMNTVMKNYIAKLLVMEDMVPSIYVLINLHFRNQFTVV